MVKLSLSSNKGNGGRYFPHAGYLALTPLKVEGVVRTRLDDDRKPILASDILVAVRCYEARIGRTGVTHTNLLVDYHVVVWSKPSHQSWAEVGDGEWPFKLVLPAKMAGYSTASFQEYRVFWRVEAVLNHIPMTGVGHRQIRTYELPIVRYDAGQTLPCAPNVWSHTRLLKSHGSLRYVITTPPLSLGPLDLVPVSLKLSPSNPSDIVHAAAIALERRIEFHSPPSGSRTTSTDDGSLSSTTNLIAHSSQPPSPKPSTPKSTTSILTTTETTDIPRDENGLFVKTITFQIPAQKSTSHWAIGETMRTELVTLRFFLHVKVTLLTSQGTYETVDLDERELYFIATNESQRRVAISKYHEALERVRSREPTRLPSPPPSPTDTKLPPTPLTASSLHSKPSAKGKSVRRPHTSAGPRDSAREISRRAPQSFREMRSRSSRGQPHSPADRSEMETIGQPDHVRAWEDELKRIETRGHRKTDVEIESPHASPTLLSAPTLKTYFAPPVQSSPPPFRNSNNLLAPPEDCVQAWEDELERIAAQSRRRSVEMLGFNPERRTRPRIDVTASTPVPKRY